MKPRMTAGYDDRQRTIALLQRLAIDGRLKLDELVTRTDAAYSAVTLADLAALTADLRDDPAREPAGSGPSDSPRLAADTARAGKRRRRA
jgi:CubicO group peptidase (beta-lactamase class C family)